MNEIIVKEEIKIEDMIFQIRGKQVIMDKDLATLYQVETRVINQTVKRNIVRFPEEFCFQLTKEDVDGLRPQFVFSKTRGDNRYLPYVFTEQGVAMLNALLNSEIAIMTSIEVINAFVVIRKHIGSNLLEQRYYKYMLLRHDEKIKLLQNTFSKFDTFSNEIFFDGQI